MFWRVDEGNLPNAAICCRVDDDRMLELRDRENIEGGNCRVCIYQGDNLHLQMTGGETMQDPTLCGSSTQ